jgi:hypothetical protein
VLRGVTMDGTRKELGIMAALGVGVCCGLPLLLGAATLAATGVLVGSLGIVAAGVALIVIAGRRITRRSRDASDACCTPEARRYLTSSDPKERP